MENNKNKFPYILIGIIASSILSVIVYVYYQTYDGDFPIKRFIIAVSIILLSSAVIGSLLYFLLNKKNREESIIESPKDIVDITEASQIWKEEFIKYNKIPYRTQEWEGNKITLLNENDLEIRNTRRHSDPTRETSDLFFTFEAIVRNGRKIGTLVASIPIDLGKEFIRANWNTRIDYNLSLNNFDLLPRKYPATSSKSYLERLNIKKAQLLEEDYSKEEIDEVIDPFMKTPQTIQVIQKPEQIKSDNLSEIYPQYFENDDEDIDSEDINQDIEEYRRRNR